MTALPTRCGLPEHAIDKLHSVFRRYPDVERVILYGSRAKGNWRPGSDIDLTLEGRELSLAQRFAIETEIDDLLLPWMVDLSLKEEIDNPALLDHIARRGVLFYRRTSGAEQNSMPCEETSRSGAPPPLPRRADPP